MPRQLPDIVWTGLTALTVVALVIAFVGLDGPVLWWLAHGILVVAVVAALWDIATPRLGPS